MSRLILASRIAKTSQNTALSQLPSVFWTRTAPSATTTSFSSTILIIVKRVFANKMKHAWHVPLDIFGQTGQDLLVVGFIRLLS